jgi:Domain of unknown function (DUF222)/HNH endonuclease
MAVVEVVDSSAVDYDLIPHGLRVELLQAFRRQRAKIDAREQKLLHAMATDAVPGLDGDPGLDKQWVREDVACALRIAPALAQARLHAATELVTRLPGTLSLLGRGAITMQHAHRLVDSVRPLPDPTAAQVEARVLDRAPQQTAAQFAASVRRAVLACDPRGSQDRELDALAQRRVVLTPQPDGVTELWALLPAAGAAALKAALDDAAARGRGLDDRTADQRRADALIDLATGATGTPGTAAPTGTGRALRPALNITVALSTLLGLDERPAELDGHGPIPAALARRLATDPTGTWRRLLTDETGRLLDVGRRTYRPPATLARHVRTQYRTCCFPGCPRPARHCELDHITAWAHGGPTTPDNLQPLCPRHHHLKHDTPWHVTRTPDGTTHWQSPSGHTYSRPPDDLPRDTTTTDPPPPQTKDPPPF